MVYQGTAVLPTTARASMHRTDPMRMGHTTGVFAPPTPPPPPNGITVPLQKFYSTGTAHLQDGQRQLHADGCPRVVAGHIHQLVLQMEQDCPPLLQPLLSVLQLALDPLEELDVVVLAVQLATYVLQRTTSQSPRQQEGRCSSLTGYSRGQISEVAEEHMG